MCLLDAPTPDTRVDDAPALDEKDQEIHDLSDTIADELYATLPDPTDVDKPFTPITHEELVSAQLHDALCSEIRRKMNGGVVLPFGLNEHGILCRQVSHDQIVVPHSLKAKVLHIHHYSRQAGHPGGRKLYCALKRHMYWPAMAVDCYATVRRCTTCAKNRIKLRQNCNELQLFPAIAPLESVALDIFGELIKTARGNQYLLVISDRFTKLTKVVPLKTVQATEIAQAFTHEWVTHYGPPRELLSDNAQYFDAKFFQSVCKVLNVQNQY